MSVTSDYDGADFIRLEGEEEGVREEEGTGEEEAPSDSAVVNYQTRVSETLLAFNEAMERNALDLVSAYNEAEEILRMITSMREEGGKRTESALALIQRMSAEANSIVESSAE